MNPDRVQSSVLVDLKDPIQVHLLTETALSDSKQYVVLSQEEVDDLKKQCQSLSQRIDQTRANLVIQSKYRDAAISMSKLYSPTRPESKRRSLLGNRNSGGDTAREADLERKASERRCEELAAELWNLEKRLMVPQRQLLEHTAGILQLTHKASKRAGQPQNTQQSNGIPGSPESLYTYSNSRSSMEPPPDDDFFDDDDGELRSRRRKNPIEIPMKSPVREQNTQLREQSDRLREENGQLLAQADALRLEADALRRENAQRLRSISEMERKLEKLNNSLRDVIVTFNPGKNSNYKTPPYGLANGSDRSLEPGDMLGSQLSYLEKGLLAVRDEQELQANTRSKDTDSEAEAAAAAAAVSLAQAEGRIEGLNRQIGDLLTMVNPRHPPPPDSSGADLDGQFAYLQESLGVVETELVRATEAAKVSKGRKDDQSDSVLRDMWATIQRGFAGVQQKKEERRRARSEKGLDADDDEMSEDEPFNSSEPYSLAALAERVRWLSKQSTSLKEQQSVLKRQIKQQRELNSKSDSEKELELNQKQEELDQTKAFISRSQEEANQAKGMLSQALKDLDSLQKSTADGQSAAKTFEDQLRQRNVTIGTLQAANQELESKLSNAQASVQELDGELSRVKASLVIMELQIEDVKEQKAAADAATEEKQKEVEAKEQEIKAKEEELDQMSMTLVELKTEVTIAKAELDGAYGSKAQRAAEAKTIIKNSSEVAEFLAEIAKLKGELSDTVKELENMTKETISVEREKLELEAKLDDAQSNQSVVESDLESLRETVTKLQEELDAQKLKVVPDAGAGGKAGAGASMLSEQFRTTMREERKKFQEDIKVRRSHTRIYISPPDPGLALTVSPTGGKSQDQEAGGGAQPLEEGSRAGQEPAKPAIGGSRRANPARRITAHYMSSRPLAIWVIAHIIYIFLPPPLSLHPVYRLRTASNFMGCWIYSLLAGRGRIL